MTSIPQITPVVVGESNCTSCVVSLLRAEDMHWAVKTALYAIAFFVAAALFVSVVGNLLLFDVVEEFNTQKLRDQFERANAPNLEAIRTLQVQLDQARQPKAPVEDRAALQAAQVDRAALERLELDNLNLRQQVGRHPAELAGLREQLRTQEETAADRISALREKLVASKSEHADFVRQSSPLIRRLESALEQAEIHSSGIQRRYEFALSDIERFKGDIKAAAAIEKQNAEQIQNLNELIEDQRRCTQSFEDLHTNARLELETTKKTLSELEERFAAVSESLRKKETEIEALSGELSRTQESEKSLQDIINAQKRELDATASLSADWRLKFEQADTLRIEAAASRDSFQEQLNALQSSAQGETSELSQRLLLISSQRDDAQRLNRTLQTEIDGLKKELLATKQREDQLRTKCEDLSKRLIEAAERAQKVGEAHTQRVQDLVAQQTLKADQIMSLTNDLMKKTNAAAWNRDRTLAQNLAADRAISAASEQSSFTSLGLTASLPLFHTGMAEAAEPAESAASATPSRRLSDDLKDDLLEFERDFNPHLGPAVQAVSMDLPAAGAGAGVGAGAGAGGQ
ncbi:MAG: hypothetical protein HYX48_03305 [Chlamydiales bacterium]|nr:hypothetical protein [Chlamydiales bacterium]